MEVIDCRTNAVIQPISIYIDVYISYYDSRKPTKLIYNPLNGKWEFPLDWKDATKPYNKEQYDNEISRISAYRRFP